MNYRTFACLVIFLFTAVAAAPGAVKKPAKVQPKWKLSHQDITIPLGEERPVRISGRLTGALSLEDYDAAVVTVRYESRSRTIVIKGMEPGSTSLTVLAGDEKKVLTIRVKKYAGRLPPAMSIVITGREAGEGGLPRPELISQAIVANLALKAFIEPGAHLKTEIKPFAPSPGDMQAAIIATLTGAQYLPVTRKIDVHLLQRTIQLNPPDYLVISNHPEKISSECVVLDENLPGKRNGRLLFHHSNSPGSATRRLVVKLINPGPSDSEIHILHSVVGPSTDEIYAGHMATSLFWKGWQRQEGYIVTVPPGETFALDDISMKPGHLVSGLSHFTHLEGPAPRLVMEALGGDEDTADPPSPTVRSRGVFMNPAIEIDRTHTVGKGYTFIYLGGKPYIKEKSTRQENLGNYGVIYTIDITMENPHEDENEVALCFVPGAGPARGIFLFDDSLFETPLAVNLQEIVLHRAMLAPGETRRVRLSTFPQSGSNYPVRIVIKSKLLQ